MNLRWVASVFIFLYLGYSPSSFAISINCEGSLGPPFHSNVELTEELGQILSSSEESLDRMLTVYFRFQNKDDYFSFMANTRDLIDGRIQAFNLADTQFHGYEEISIRGRLVCSLRMLRLIREAFPTDSWWGLWPIPERHESLVRKERAKDKKRDQDQNRPNFPVPYNLRNKVQLLNSLPGPETLVTFEIYLPEGMHREPADFAIQQKMIDFGLIPIQVYPARTFRLPPAQKYNVPRLSRVKRQLQRLYPQDVHINALHYGMAAEALKGMRIFTVRVLGRPEDIYRFMHLPEVRLIYRTPGFL